MTSPPIWISTLGSSTNYAFTVREASAIWDELSMHLVAARGAKLNYAHERAELLHQVLLQGTADLEEVQTNVRRHIARIDQALDRHLDEYDRKLTERPIAGTQSTREALRRGRLVELTRRSATNTSGEADRAVEATQSLLDAIARAFDERRVRMTDKLGVLALVAAVALAVVPFVTELWARFISGMSSDSSQIPLLASVTVLLIGAFLTRRYFNHSFGTLRVSHEFRRRYQSLLELMTATRTELFDGERTTLRHAIKSAVPIPRPESAPTNITYTNRDGQRTAEWNRYYAHWDGLDQELAEKCADQIDQLQRPFEENRRRARWRLSSWGRLLHRHKETEEDELAMLGDKIELWALRSLFITERPRQIYRFPLIRLILLYSAYETWFETLHPRPTPSLVANSELMLATRLHCHAEDREAKIVAHWIATLAATTHAAKKSARKILERIDAVGFKGSMSRADWERALATIHRDTSSNDVGVLRTLAPRDPGRYIPDLATALVSLGQRHAALHETDQELDVHAEAVAWWFRLAATNLAEHAARYRTERANLACLYLARGKDADTAMRAERAAAARISAFRPTG